MKINFKAYTLLVLNINYLYCILGHQDLTRLQIKESASEVYNTSEIKCYPFLMDEEFIKCAESKSGSSGQTINETGATFCCLYEFVDRINKSYDEFIVDYLRADNVSITCNNTQDNLTAPLAFNWTNSCGHEDSSEGVLVCNSTCVQDYIRSGINIGSSFYNGCFMELKSDLKPYRLVAVGFVILLILFGVVLNCSVLIVYCKQRSLWKPLNLYLVSTLLADTLVLIIIQPMYLKYIVEDGWVLGDLACKVYLSNIVMLFFVILYLTTALSVERYHLIANCLQSFTADADNTKKRVIAVNLSVWIFAFLFSVPCYIKAHVSEDNVCIYLDNTSEFNLSVYVRIGVQVFFGFVLPFSLILIFYILTFFKIRKRIVNAESRSNTDEIKSREKTAKAFLVIIAIYLLCHLPMNILLFKIVTDTYFTPWQKLFDAEVLWLVCYYILSINFCSNSVIILIISSEVRAHVYNLKHTFIKKTK